MDVITSLLIVHSQSSDSRLIDTCIISRRVISPITPSNPSLSQYATQTDQSLLLLHHSDFVYSPVHKSVSVSSILLGLSTQLQTARANSQTHSTSTTPLLSFIHVAFPALNLTSFHSPYHQMMTTMVEAIIQSSPTSSQTSPMDGG